MNRFCRSLVAAAVCSLIVGTAAADGKPDVSMLSKTHTPTDDCPQGSVYYQIRTSNVGIETPFNRLCVDINQVPPGRHPMQNRVSIVSAKNGAEQDSAGWSANVVYEGNKWQLCLDRSSNETNNITFKLCIKPIVDDEGRVLRRGALNRKQNYRYYRGGTPLPSQSGARGPVLLPVVYAHPADLNGDGTVDGADLGLLLSNWGSGTIGDLNGDGVVDGADLGILLSNWGPVEEPPCDDAICVDAICEISPLCCDADWDLACAWLAHDLCGCDEPTDLPWQPVDQSCVDPGELAGCEDPLLVACVCAADPFCCTVEWDSQCAMHALVECNALGAEFAVYDADMIDLTSGDLILIRGVGFPEDPNDLHLSIRPWMPKPDPDDLLGAPEGGIAGPATGSRLAIIATTPTSVIAQVRGVAPSVPVGMIVAQLGTGVATIPPGIPSVVVPALPGIIYWSTLTPATAISSLHAIPLLPIPSTPPQCAEDHGGLLGTALTVTLAGIPDPLPAGSTLEIDVDGTLLSGGFQFAQQMTLTTSSALSITQTANAICATLNQVFFQQTGQFFPCTSQVVGPNTVQINVEPPFGDNYDPNQFNAFWLRVCEP